MVQYSAIAIFVRQGMHLFFEEFAVYRSRGQSHGILQRSPNVHTCESGSMAASDGLVPSLPLLLCGSFEYVAGEVGLRGTAIDILLVAIGSRISVGGEKDCEQLLALTFSDRVFARITSVLRASSTDQWVCYFEFRQQFCHFDVW